MQISKRLVGMHPDKVLDALQHHIDAGHEVSALQAIPDLQVQHPQFHNELEQQKARLSARLIDGVKVLDRKTAEVFQCVNCGGPLARQNPESKHVICQYCGCDAIHPANDIRLERWNEALDLESRFTVGDFFQYANRRWQAIGVQLFSGSLREYDKEDKKWETSNVRYTSWWMLNEHRELAWLIDDGKCRYWAEKYIPMEPFNPDSSDRHYEHGQWKLEFAAGEFSYQPKQGERHDSAEHLGASVLPVRPGGPHAGYQVSIETRLDENQNPKEIEFIRSQRIDDSEMFKALGNDPELSGINRWKRSINMLLVALPLLAVIAFMINRGGEVISQSVDITSQSEEVVLQTINVEESGTRYEFNASVSQLDNNSWMGVDLALANDEGEPVYQKYLEFWQESGRDSDGPWLERQSNIQWFVRIDEPGAYRVVVSVEPSSSTKASGFTLRTEPNRSSSLPFMLAAGFTVFMVIMFLMKISAVKSVAASIAVKVKKRFEPEGQPKADPAEQWS